MFSQHPCSDNVPCNNQQAGLRARIKHYAPAIAIESFAPLVGTKMLLLIISLC